MLYGPADERTPDREVGNEANVIKAQLAKVLADDLFSRAERLSRFLSYVVEESLAGRGEQLKESVIAGDVLNRAARHDPKTDSIVRKQASDLRRKLAQYYASTGRDDAIGSNYPKVATYLGSSISSHRRSLSTKMRHRAQKFREYSVAPAVC